MNVWQAAFVMLALSAVVAVVGLAIDFYRFNRRHRNIRRNVKLMRVIGLPQADDRSWQQKFMQEQRR